MISYGMKYSEELQNIIIESMVEGKRTTGYPWNSQIGQIKNDEVAEIFIDLKKKRQAIE